MERGTTRAAVDLTAPAGGAEIRARARRLAGNYQALAAEAHAAAVSWRWATPTSAHGFVEPLRLERMGCAPGRWRDGPAPRGTEHEAIGLDTRGRVVCVRQHDATGEVWLERFARWSSSSPAAADPPVGVPRAADPPVGSPAAADPPAGSPTAADPPAGSPGDDSEVEVACFSPPLPCGDGVLPAQLQCLTVMRLEGGLPAASDRYLPPTDSCSHECYRHEGGRLARVDEGSVVKEVVYGDDGRVAGIDAVGPAGREAVWRDRYSGAPPS